MEERFYKKVLVFTGWGCNSKCIFCFQETRKPEIFPVRKIVQDLIDGKKKGANWLVLMGGESTIHPNFLDILLFAKKLGYERIQLVSNGRMFSNRDFAKKSAQRGLTEVTISFHGHNAKLHDKLTQVPGSFKQAVEGAKNCRDFGIKLSFNTALNKYNVLKLKDIAKLIYDLGFYNSDYDIIGTAVEGKAWNKKMYPTHSDVKKGYKALFDFAEKKGMVVWITRTNIDDLPKDYEYHKEPWEVIYHDALAIWDRVWAIKKPCYEKIRCEYCEAQIPCKHFEIFRKKVLQKKIDAIKGTNFFKNITEVTKNMIVHNEKEMKLCKKNNLKPINILVYDGLKNKWQKVLEEYKKQKALGIDVKIEFQINKKSKKHIASAKNLNVVFSPTNPSEYVLYSFESSNRLEDTTKSIMNLKEIFKLVKGPFTNVPLCIKSDAERRFDILDTDMFDKNGKPFPEKLVKEWSKHVKVFPLKCSECVLKSECPGFFGDYVKLFGFDEIHPIKTPDSKKEL